MNKTQINNKLIAILKKYPGFYESVPELVELSNALKSDVYHETITHDKSLKQRNSAALSFLKKIQKNEVRKVLSYAKTINDKKYITDTYIMLELPEDFQLPECPEELHYPDVSFILKRAMEDAEPLDLDVNDIMKQYKAGLIQPEEDETITFYRIPNTSRDAVDLKRLETAYKILGSVKNCFYGKNRILVLEAPDGARAFVCAMLVR